MKTDRVFLTYIKGKCTVQPVGIHTIANMPRKIAEFLKLPHFQEYTGHCFRRTSATMLVEGGGSMFALKSLGGWRSSSVAEGYIEESECQKIQIAKTIMKPAASTSSSSSSVEPIEVTYQNSMVEPIFHNSVHAEVNNVPIELNQELTKNAVPLNLSGTFTNCTFNINFVNNKE